MGRTATVSKAVGEGRLPKALPAFSSVQLKKAAQAAFEIPLPFWCQPLQNCRRKIHRAHCLAELGHAVAWMGPQLLHKGGKGQLVIRRDQL